MQLPTFINNKVETESEWNTNKVSGHCDHEILR